MIEHSVGSSDGSIILNNINMEGQLLSADGETVVKTWTNTSRVYTIVIQLFRLS